MKYVSTKEAASILDLHPNSLRAYADEGKINYIRTPKGHRRYDISSFIKDEPVKRLICYCRVSSYKQKDDLERQISFMLENYKGAEIVKDIGSGINFKRKGLQSILESSVRGDCITIVVAHKDRLARFGFELIKYIIELNGGKILVHDQSIFSPEQELTKDLLNILHVFSCRMHGLRHYKKQINQDLSHKSTKTDIL